MIELAILYLAVGLVPAGVTLDEQFPIATCKDAALPPSVDALLKPVLLARAMGLRRESAWYQPYEDAFYRLLDMKGATALEAKVALMAYYTGEHSGHELLEKVGEQRQLADPLVRRYSACRPRTSFEEQLDPVVVLRTLYTLYGEVGARE